MWGFARGLSVPIEDDDRFDLCGDSDDDDALELDDQT